MYSLRYGKFFLIIKVIRGPCQSIGHRVNLCVPQNKQCKLELYLFLRSLKWSNLGMNFRDLFYHFFIRLRIWIKTNPQIQNRLTKMENTLIFFITKNYPGKNYPKIYQKSGDWERIKQEENFHVIQYGPVFNNFQRGFVDLQVKIIPMPVVGW